MFLSSVDFIALSSVLKSQLNSLGIKQFSPPALELGQRIILTSKLPIALNILNYIDLIEMIPVLVWCPFWWQFLTTNKKVNEREFSHFNYDN